MMTGGYLGNPALIATQLTGPVDASTVRRAVPFKQPPPMKMQFIFTFTEARAQPRLNLELGSTSGPRARAQAQAHRSNLPRASETAAGQSHAKRRVTLHLSCKPTCTTRTRKVVQAEHSPSPGVGRVGAPRLGRHVPRESCGSCDKSPKSTSLSLARPGPAVPDYKARAR